MPATPNAFSVLNHPSLEHIWVGFGSKKKNRKLEEMMEENGINTGDFPDFEFK